MLEELTRAANERLDSLRTRRYPLAIASIHSHTKNAVGEFEAFVTAAARNKSRFVVITDGVGYNLFRICSNYPRKAVWLIVAVGRHDEFENIREFVCPSGEVMYVDKVPLTKKQDEKLGACIRTAANQCSF
ncbi:hypothetical protein C4556_00390 [Candidatus Parcubacteria bacterium]|nr:MAG: hypothetical protein C4556_00390 [Candidatus Parcubacteria bacterium]